MDPSRMPVGLRLISKEKKWLGELRVPRWLLDCYPVEITMNMQGEPNNRGMYMISG